MHFKEKNISKELVSFLNSPFFIIVSRNSTKNIKQSYKYEISSRCENNFCLVSIEIFRWLKSFCKIDTFKLIDEQTPKTIPNKKKYKTILKSVNKGSLLHEYSVCLLHFYEPEGKLGKKVWLTKQSTKNTIIKT